MKERKKKKKKEDKKPQTHPPEIPNDLVERGREHVADVAEDALVRLHAQALADLPHDDFEAVGRADLELELREARRGADGREVDAHYPPPPLIVSTHHHH